MIRSCYSPCKPKCNDLPKVPSEMVIYNEDLLNYINSIILAIKTLGDSLHKVAYSGDYLDIENKPTIGDGIITITQGDNFVGNFNVNSTEDIDINIPTDNLLNDLSTNPVQNKTIYTKFNQTINDLLNFTKNLTDPLYQSVDLLTNSLNSLRSEFDLITKDLGSYIHYSDNSCKWDINSELDNTIYKGDNTIDFVILSPKVTGLKSDTFNGCVNLKSIIFPQDGLITSIGDNCFKNCTSLSNILFPETIATIGNSAFYNSGLKYININNKYFTSLGKSVFENCSNLIEVNINLNNTTLKSKVLKGCTSLKRVLLSGISTIHSTSFVGSNNIEYLSITNSTVDLSSEQFKDFTKLLTAVLTGVINIGTNCFKDCIKLENVQFSNILISIGQFAFDGCTSLNEITIPDGLTNNRISDYGLYGASLNKVVLLNPNEVVTNTTFNSQVTVYSEVDSAVLTACATLNIPFIALNSETIVDLVNTSTTAVTSRAVKTAIEEANPIFLVTYNVTTYSQIETAYNNGKVILCYYGNKVFILRQLDNVRAYFVEISGGLSTTVNTLKTTLNILALQCLNNNNWSSFTTLSGADIQKSVFFAQYETSSYIDMLTAATNGKLVLCINGDKLYILKNQTYSLGSNLEFTCYNYTPSKVTQNNETKYGYTNVILKVSAADTWTLTNTINDTVIVSDTITSTSTDKALSANQGKLLQDLINDLKAIGRFLSVWDCTLGLPESDPVDMPYTYHTGDYYIVGVVGSTNYKPNGSSYDGTPSVIVETVEIQVGDIYMYDGTTWVFQLNHQRVVPIDTLLSTTSTNAVENRVVTNAINSIDHIYIVDYINPDFTSTASAYNANKLVLLDVNNVYYRAWFVTQDKILFYPIDNLSSVTNTTLNYEVYLGGYILNDDNTWSSNASNVNFSIPKEVFIATADITTYAELTSAYNAGKMIAVNYSGVWCYLQEVYNNNIYIFYSSPYYTLNSTPNSSYIKKTSRLKLEVNSQSQWSYSESKLELEIENRLDSTSTTRALSSAQGKALQDNKADKATTLAGYGITDAHITNGVITLGNNSITPASGAELANFEIVIAQALNNINTRLETIENALNLNNP